MTNNLDKFREYNNKRNKIKKLLDIYSNKEEIKTIKKECALTKSLSCHLEHFIPIAWGHGGDYIGNVYYLEPSLNRQKSGRNPFLWAEDMIVEKQIIREDWEVLIHKLALQNNMKLQEFREYIFWCEENKRTLEQLEFDNTATITLWENSKVK